MAPDFLTEMAASTGGDDKKKNKTPIVTLPKRSAEAKVVDQLASALREQKDIKGRVEALKAEITDFAVQRRNAECSKDGKYYSSVKLVGASGETLSVVTRGQYSKIPMSSRDEIEEVLDGESFDERFATRVSVKIDNDALQDPSNQGLLERLVKRHPRLKSMLEVSAYYEPKDSWVKTFMFSEDEQRIVDELEEREIMKPYSPTFR